MLRRFFKVQPKRSFWRQHETKVFLITGLRGSAASRRRTWRPNMAAFSPQASSSTRGGCWESWGCAMRMFLSPGLGRRWNRTESARWPPGASGWGLRGRSSGGKSRKMDTRDGGVLWAVSSIPASKGSVLRDAEWFSVGASALGAGCDPSIPGSSPASGSLQGPSFSLCLGLS